MEEKPFKIRDLRKKQQFIIDDVYLNGYAKLFGTAGTAVYLSLCRRANKEQYCFPSQKLIAKDHGITERTARKYIGVLKQANLIKIGREKSKQGKWLNNVYYLLDKSAWLTPREIFSSGILRKIKAQPEEDNGLNHRQQFPTKDSNEKDLNMKERREKALDYLKEVKQKLIESKKLPG